MDDRSDPSSSPFPFLEHRAGTKRKYLAEAGLNLYSREPVCVRPSDIHPFGKDEHLRERMEGSNVYVICRRRRISVDPHSLRLSDGVLYGKLQAHLDAYGQWEPYPFSMTCWTKSPDGRTLGFQDMRPIDPFGHAIDVIDGLGRRFTVCSHHIVARGKHSLADRAKLEVLYVGQTFGAKGDLIALDRLARHSTLQRILAESAEEFGLSEILLLAYQYGNAKNILSSASASWVEASATSKEEQAHFMKVGKQTFTRRDRILLAEAGLINYFKPRYNTQHIDSFSSKERRKKLSVLRPLLEADFSALTVEISSSSVASKLWSAAAPKAAMDQLLTHDKFKAARGNAEGSGVTGAELEQWVDEQSHVHVAKAALYDARERETFLNGLGWA